MSDIYRNKIDFAREEFATELPRPKGIPKPREVKSQTSQIESHVRHDVRKDTKVNMSDKLS